jgi:hypothetical protein
LLANSGPIIGPIDQQGNQEMAGNKCLVTGTSRIWVTVNIIGRNAVNMWCNDNNLRVNRKIWLASQGYDEALYIIY